MSQNWNWNANAEQMQRFMCTQVCKFDLNTVHRCSVLNVAKLELERIERTLYFTYT